MSLLIVATLTLMLSGCSADDEFEGMNIITFEINGGVFNYGTSSIDTAIKYAYHPGTYIKDPLTINQNRISRNGYNFTGWYTSPECKDGEKWEFYKTADADLTLYAGWELAIQYTYTVKYTDDTANVITLGLPYVVEAGEPFEDWRRVADKREGYTALGFYADPACEVPWDFFTLHPGGDSDLDIPVYVKYLEGEWALVNNGNALINAIKNGENVYLTCDIDLGGDEISGGSFGDFGGIFEGNGYTVSNFTVSKSGTTFSPTLAIFRTLEENAEIRNVSFENVTYKLFDVADAQGVRVSVAALAVNMTKGAIVKDVTVSGALHTNYGGELPRLLDVYCYRDEDDTGALDGVSGFMADITVSEQ